MIIQTFQRIFKTDFSADDQGLVDKLAGILNPGIERLYQLANKKISINDNIDCVVRDVTFSVDANGNPTATTSFTLDDKTRSVQGLQVIRATSTNSNTYPSGGIFCSFQQTQTGIQLLNVTGLPANTNFTLRIIGYY